MSTVMPQDSETSAPRRRFTLWHLSVILIVIGLFITAYLSYTHLTDSSVACIGGENSAFNCDAVNSNPYYANFIGIYVGYLGLAADLFLFVVLILEPRIQFLRSYGVIIVFAVVLLGWLYHDYLTYVSITLIQHLCIWCLTEHTIMTILLIVTGIRLYRILFTSSEPEEA